MTERGIVKWYSLAKGYGFLRREAEDGSPETEDADVFIHHTEAPDPPPVEGERVRFDLVDGPKGPAARNVKRLADDESGAPGVTGSPSEVVGVVLAGGRSRRMGLDKARLRLDGESLLERAIARLLEVTPEVLVADRGNGLAPGRRSVEDGPGAGPAAGILGAAVACPGRDLLVLACDLPAVPPALLRHLATPIEEDAHVPRWHRGLEPLCALYRPAALTVMAGEARAGRLALHAMLGQLSIRTLEDDALAAFGAPERVFFNLNTPRDFEALRPGCKPKGEG